MKFPALSFIIAGAGLLQANASPLRVIWVSPEAASLSTGSDNESVAHILLRKSPIQHHATNGTHRGCVGGLFRQKAVDLSNTLRAALGMPLIETKITFHNTAPGKKHDGVHKHHHHHHEHPDDEMKMAHAEEGRVHHQHTHHHHKEHDEVKTCEEQPHQKHHLHGKGNGTCHGSRHRQASFFRRLHFALVSLGPWEGRALAFVIGCGIGVLLRMLFVLTVIASRALRGDREEVEYVPVPHQEDAEEIFVAPPVYIVDEKSSPKEEMASN